MIKEENIPKTYQYLLGFCAFLIGAYSKWILLGIIPITLLILYGWKKGRFSFQWSFLQGTWALLYFTYVIYSLLYWNATLSPKQIEYKLSWLLFPVIFSLIPQFTLDKKYTVEGLTYGVILASIVGIAKAIGTCVTIGLTLTSYTSSNICINHPTYFSATATIAAILIIENWNQPVLFSHYPWVKKIILVFLIAMILLSFSMAGFLFFAMMGGLYLATTIFQPNVSKIIKLTFLGLPILLALLLSQNDFIKGEFNNTRQALIQFVNNPKEFISSKTQAQNGDEIRLIMWTATFLEIKEHPIGVGPTNIGNHLSSQLKKLNQPQLAEQNTAGEVHYNPHNQYLQMALEIGWAPLGIFIITLTWLIIIGIRYHLPALTAIVLLLGFHCLFESILQRQSGIVTFTFFISLYSLYYKVNSSRKIRNVA